jgi:aerobic-type carbon monoxide dehydrogenase small subunit (CoxS/CutS family)
MRIELRVNGEQREADVHGAESLLFVLRERLDLPGAKGACEEGECGSCSVLLDGQLVCACLVHGAQADGREVVTVEGLATDGALLMVRSVFDLRAIAPGFESDGVLAMSVSFTGPPIGVWYFAMILTEFVDGSQGDDGYVLRYFINFPVPEYFGVPLPPNRQ